MTEAQQKRRAVLQARCIRKYAKKLRVSLGEGFGKWVTSNNAERWANYSDKGEKK